MKPILFNTEMVRAILAGRKTATWRVIKPQPDEHLATGESALELLAVVCGPYRPGDILYVRETWAKVGDKAYGYKADDIWSVPRWRPSIHMPRDAARIFLRVTDVRIERLKDITLNDVAAEGTPEPTREDWAITEYGTAPPFCWFARLWDSTIKSADLSLYSWDANPWVWVIEFERIEKEDIPCE